MAASRKRQAQSYVYPYLARLSDRDLAELGHSPSDIVEIRKHANDGLMARF